MKLRILDNSLRLRLTQSEIDAFRENGVLDATIRFAPGERLVYTLKATPTVRHLRAQYDPGHVTVLVPVDTAAQWTDTEQISLEGEQAIEGGEMLTILVEKDFQCLHKPADEKDPDAFPHPAE